jgi:uncharacterized membrane protein
MSMADIDARTQSIVPPESLVRIAHVVYGLHAFSAVMGMLGPAFIVTAFLTGWPSIIAVIINYVKRSDARGTYLDSHFGWQIRTFWYAVLWAVIGAILVFTVIGAVIGVPLLLLLGVWVLYRIARGWITLGNGRPMPS